MLEADVDLAQAYGKSVPICDAGIDGHEPRGVLGCGGSGTERAGESPCRNAHGGRWSEPQRRRGAAKTH
jgi:hypothetical protein